jgi:hypothetical protein
VNYSATVLNVEGRNVVTEADELIYVHDDLWEEITSGRLAEAPGGPVLDGDVLSFGMPDEGIGRVQYRYVRHDPEAKWYVMTRIA